MVSKSFISKVHELSLISFAHPNQVLYQQPLSHKTLVQGVLKTATRQKRVDDCHSAATRQPLLTVGRKGGNKLLQRPLYKLRLRIVIEGLGQTGIDRIRVQP